MKERPIDPAEQMPDRRTPEEIRNARRAEIEKLAKEHPCTKFSLMFHDCPEEPIVVGPLSSQEKPVVQPEQAKKGPKTNGSKPTKVYKNPNPDIGEKNRRHVSNLSGFTGFRRGTFYEGGIPRRSNSK